MARWTSKTWSWRSRREPCPLVHSPSRASAAAPALAAEAEHARQAKAARFGSFEAQTQNAHRRKIVNGKKPVELAEQQTARKTAAAMWPKPAAASPFVASGSSTSGPAAAAAISTTKSQRQLPHQFHFLIRRASPPPSRASAGAMSGNVSALAAVFLCPPHTPDGNAAPVIAPLDKSGGLRFLQGPVRAFVVGFFGAKRIPSWWASAVDVFEVRKAEKRERQGRHQPPGAQQAQKTEKIAAAVVGRSVPSSEIEKPWASKRQLNTAGNNRRGRGR